MEDVNVFWRLAARELQYNNAIVDMLVGRSLAHVAYSPYVAPRPVLRVIDGGKK